MQIFLLVRSTSQITPACIRIFFFNFAEIYKNLYKNTKPNPGYRYPVTMSMPFFCRFVNFLVLFVCFTLSFIFFILYVLRSLVNTKVLTCPLNYYQVSYCLCNTNTITNTHNLYFRHKVTPPALLIHFFFYKFTAPMTYVLHYL